MIVDKVSAITTEVNFDSELALQAVDLESSLGDRVRDCESSLTTFVDMTSILMGCGSCDGG